MNSVLQGTDAYLEFVSSNALYRQVQHLIERMENAAADGLEVLACLRAQDGPLDAEGRSAIAVRVAALRLDMECDLHDDEADLAVTLQRAIHELGLISGLLGISTQIPAT
jgi:hypothetical protein